MPSKKSAWKIVKRPLADGSVKEYRYPRAAPPEPLAPTVNDLLTAYKKSAEWRQHSQGTKRVYNRAIDRLKPLGNHTIDKFKRRDVLAIRDQLAHKPGVCNSVLTVLGSVFNWAIDREWIERNPAARIKRIPQTPHRRWSWAQIEHAAKTFPPPLVRALFLALYTGQRQGDLLAMRWDDYDGTGIRVTQAKTGAKLWIPLHRDLRGLIEQWPREAVTILTGAAKKPWRPESFATLFSRHCHAHDELDGLTFHGLRKTAAALLAEAGCSVHEIAAITGHKTLEMIAHYTAEADQRGRAIFAMEKMEKMASK